MKILTKIQFNSMQVPSEDWFNTIVDIRKLYKQSGTWPQPGVTKLQTRTGSSHAKVIFK